MSTMACKGASTRPVRLCGEDFEECVECRTRVQWDLVEHPFFGFAAGCTRLHQAGTVSKSGTSEVPKSC